MPIHGSPVLGRGSAIDSAAFLTAARENQQMSHSTIGTGAAVLAAIAGTAIAQPAIDGTLVGDEAVYGSALWVQTTPTAFGDNTAQILLDRASMVLEFLTRRKVLPKVRARRSPLDPAANPDLAAKIAEIADKCPVHRTIEKGAAVVTKVISTEVNG